MAFDTKKFETRLKVAFVCTVIDPERALKEMFDIMTDCYLQGVEDGAEATIQELKRQWFTNEPD